MQATSRSLGLQLLSHGVLTVLESSWGTHEPYRLGVQVQAFSRLTQLLELNVDLSGNRPAQLTAHHIAQLKALTSLSFTQNWGEIDPIIAKLNVLSNLCNLQLSDDGIACVEAEMQTLERAHQDCALAQSLTALTCLTKLRIVSRATMVVAVARSAPVALVEFTAYANAESMWPLRAAAYVGALTNLTCLHFEACGRGDTSVFQVDEYAALCALVGNLTQLREFKLAEQNGIGGIVVSDWGRALARPPHLEHVTFVRDNTVIEIYGLVLRLAHLRQLHVIEAHCRCRDTVRSELCDMLSRGIPSAEWGMSGQVIASRPLRREVRVEVLGLTVVEL